MSALTNQSALNSQQLASQQQWQQYVVSAGTTASNAQTLTITGNTYYGGGTNIALSNPYPVGIFGQATPDMYAPAIDMICITRDGKIELPKGREVRVPLGDGSTLYVDSNGNFRVDDKNAKVVYKANRVREFNPFVNASDLLAEFLRYVGTLGVRRSEVQTLPLGLFVNWLVIRAAEIDADPVPADIVPLPEHRLLKGRVSPRCLVCQRYVRRIAASSGFAFCNPLCATKMHLRLVA